MSITFEKTAVPTRARSGRTALPNPFTSQFPCDDEALVFSIPQGLDSTEARRLIRQARQAAKAVDRSAQIMHEVDGEGTRFTIWTTERMTRG